MKFDGKQILATFVKMEEEVSQYYLDLAENAGDDKSKKLFKQLSLEEDKHHKMYSKLLELHGDDLEREFSEEEVEQYDKDGVALVDPDTGETIKKKINKNKEIIKKEIDFFKPKLVVCIGNKARDLVGMRFYDFPVQFHYVKFPKYHSNNNIYLELNEIFKKIID